MKSLEYRILSRLPLGRWLQVLEYLSQSDVLNVSEVYKELHASAEYILSWKTDWNWRS